MHERIESTKMISQWFREAVHASLWDTLGLKDEQIETYLGQMLVEFLHFDGIYKLRDESGRPIKAVTEMVAEGDVRLKASSFDREREVHKHVGDFLLFWSGMFPEQLQALPAPDRVIDCEKQGAYSYYVVSTFDHGRYADEAPVFRKLSEEFEACRLGLSLVRRKLGGLAS
ncbi:MAG: hypothetical protein IT363_10205 [Methanoregulaceae archaeon]|nr:hypothetical protein [Methanoregulaceae archaeon]